MVSEEHGGPHTPQIWVAAVAAVLKALHVAPPGRCPLIPIPAHPWARMPARCPSLAVPCPAAIPQPLPACSRSGHLGGQEST